MILGVSTNRKRAGGAGKWSSTGHLYWQIQDQHAYHFSTPVSEKLFSGNLPAAFLSTNICCRGCKEKVDFFCLCAGVLISSPLVLYPIQMVSADILGVQSFQRPPFVSCHHPGGNNIGQSAWVNQLVTRIWTVARRGEDPSSVERAAKLKTSHQDFEVLTFCISGHFLSSSCDFAVPAGKLINRSHQQEVLRPIRPCEQGQGQAGIRLCVNREACLP